MYNTKKTLLLPWKVHLKLTPLFSCDLFSSVSQTQKDGHILTHKVKMIIISLTGPSSVASGGNGGSSTSYPN